MSESNPLVQRVDALLKRHQQQTGPGAPAAAPIDVPANSQPAPTQVPTVEPSAALAPLADPAPFGLPAGDGNAVISPSLPPGLDDDIPVLTEIVDPQGAPGESAPAPGKALVEEIEAAVIERVLAELDRSLDRRLNRTVGEVLEQSMDGLRADLSDHVRRAVREAVAAALARGNPDSADRS